MTSDHQETIRRKQSALRTILENMEMPELRLDTTKMANIRWLNRNLAVDKSDHPMFETAKNMIIWLLKNQGRAS